MKIISNFKDFYDFGTIYDTDESIVYNRETQIISISKENKINYKISNENYSLLTTLTGIHNGPGSMMFTTSNGGPIIFYKTIIGIYPDIYILPILAKVSFDWYGRSEVLETYRLGGLEELFQVDKLEEIAKKEGWRFSEFRGKGKRKEPVIDIVLNENLILNKSIAKSVEDLVIPGRRTLFHSLGSPVFYVNPHQCYLEVDCCIKDIQHTDIRSLIPISNQIYSRIEEFIIESELKEIPEPDNDTKIINSGFDLKTSFRNV